MKKEFSQAGISLVQVMVSLAIMAVAQLALMKMSETQNKNTKTTEVKFESIEIINNIRSVLSDKAACRATFGPILPAPPASPVSGVYDPNSEPANFITEIKNANGITVYESGVTSTIGGTQVKIKSFSMDSSVAPASSILPGESGRTHLEVTLDRTDKIYGAQEITKKILLNVRTIDDGSGNPVIVECSTAATGNSLPTIAEYVCKTVGGVFLATGRDGDGDCSDIAPYGKSIFSKPPIVATLPAPVTNLGADIYGPLIVYGNTTIQGNLDITNDGEITMTSDKRLKHRIRTLKNVLDKIEGLRGVRYIWNQSFKRDIGVVAQELQAEFPDLVTVGGDGFLRVKYTQLTAVLLQAIKELNAKLEKQDYKIEQLSSDLIKMNKRLLDLEEKFED